MSNITIGKTTYKLTFDPKTGKIASLCDNSSSTNWVAEGDNFYFGVPFINGTQMSENIVACTVSSYDETSLQITSESQATKINYTFLEDRLILNYSAPLGCGPRMGVSLDLNLLDLATETPWQKQCMPSTIYTAPDYSYAYFVFTTANHQFMVITVEDFAAWRIKYSYEGHRMIGFQILSQADDIITGTRTPLKAVENLKISIAFEDTMQSCWNTISELLNIPIATCAVTGGVVGATIPLHMIGSSAKTILCLPDGTTKPLTEMAVKLEMPGSYQVHTYSQQGAVHISRFLCHEDWETLYDRVNNFYKDHFQHDCGAFSRVIWKDTLSSKNGVTFEGVDFGDPLKMMSCRTGEFGGFSGWAMMKNCLLYGEKKPLMDSIERYVCNWALNYGHEQTPFPGTISKDPQTFLGREYGAYHLYHEVNYPQHEIFLLEQLCDYYKLTGNEKILEDISGIVNHFIDEHMEESGAIICQNHKDGEKVDYCTVHVPISALVRCAMTVKDSALKDKLLVWSEKLADYVCERGLGFPTEGEPCTEDGSMSCSVLTLLYAYLYVKPKENYLEMAKCILDHHQVLEMHSCDCRMNGSSIRFWETQYETRDWGPSINAGHGWTIWMAEAKALMAQVCNDVNLLAQSYNGFLTNICKVEPNGGMSCSYTPDMIPGTPHQQGSYGNTSIINGDFSDLRPTSSYLGLGYQQKTYSVSGNHFLAKAGEIWSHMSGISFEKDIAINGVLDESGFKSNAAAFDHLILDDIPENSVTIHCKADTQLTIATATSDVLIKLVGADLISQQGKRLIIMPKQASIQICKAN